jgi:3'-phosphoadenosine 5'-phosphosulfate sulfotransferase (PAPS reductase)/FAD synthetase
VVWEDGRGDPASYPIERRLRVSSLLSIADIMPAQSFLFSSGLNVALTPDVELMLVQNAAVAVGVSGGKDSVACALAVARHLDEIGHTGPRLLVHADLGRIEWLDSLSSCQRLADYLGWELVVVRRKAGDMIARWKTRWANNISRYANLECVKLIHPFSTPSLRFCTSDMKVSVVTSELRRRFASLPILNVTGIRWQESTARSRKPISSLYDRLTRMKLKIPGYTWNAIIDWRIEDVFSEIRSSGLQLHEAYRVYGSSRVSCSFCIMSSAADLLASSSCADNHETYRLLVELEAISGFGFQGNRWLADVAPRLLDADLRKRIQCAKEINVRRKEIEARIPDHLLYEKGWPTAIPSRADAELLAGVRREVSSLSAIEAMYLNADSILARYEELMAEKAA